MKSLQGEPRDPADVETDRIVGRQWGLRDQRSGRILTARRRPELLGASASYDGDAPVTALPNGDAVEGIGPESGSALS